jgi:transposase-like protein
LKDGRRATVSESNQPLTPAMVREYIASGGAHCPYCKSAEIESDHVEVDGDSAWARVSCQTCDREWQDSFVLSAVGEFTEDGSTNTILPESEA